MLHPPPKSQDHINNDWRSKGQKRDINKPGPDLGAGDPQTFSYGGTNAKSM